MNNIQTNILIGSIIGDGNLALYGRSKNAYFREHGSKEQTNYRKWKANILDFKYFANRHEIRSKSEELFTKLRNEFYFNNVKTLTTENLKYLNHPIGLMTLFLDDGSLVIQRNDNKNSIYLFPRIYLYTQSFSKKENILLMNNLKKEFNVNFKLKRTPNGSNWHLEMNKRNDVNYFINLIKPFSKNIKCMQYKVNLEKRLKDEKIRLEKLTKKIIEIQNEKIISNLYSEDDEQIIINMRANRKTYQNIADKLHRSYFGIVDKIRRMKKEGKFYY